MCGCRYSCRYSEERKAKNERAIEVCFACLGKRNGGVSGVKQGKTGYLCVVVVIVVVIVKNERRRTKGRLKCVLLA